MPLRGLFLDVRAHADLGVGDGDKRPVLAEATGGVVLRLGPASLVGTHAVGVRGVLLEPRGCGVIRLVEQSAGVLLLGGEGLRAVGAGDLELLCSCVRVGAPRDDGLSLIRAGLEDGAEDGVGGGGGWRGHHDCRGCGSEGERDSGEGLSRHAD